MDFFLFWLHLQHNYFIKNDILSLIKMGGIKANSLDITEIG
jgi:hypothetical protein